MSTTVVPFVRPDKRSRTVGRPRGGTLLARLLSPLSLWLARRRQREALADLADDKRMLADIGLTREDAVREAAKSFWR